MFEKANYTNLTLGDAYSLLIEQLKHLIAGETDMIANLANASALLNQFLKEINWVGFYLYKDSELVLGPFQGLPACIRIPLDRGVCGKAARERSTINVPNVHDFPGHIACDSASKSELVIPLIDQKDNLIGVLDIDSPIYNRFSQEDQKYLEIFAKVLSHYE